MSRIFNIFKKLKETDQTAFIPFITAGDGGLDNCEALVFTLADSGADIIELGMPFSDPMADGPVIAKSHERAVSDGIDLDDVFAIVERFREHNQTTGVVLMGYTNPIEVYGYKDFAARAEEVGVDGILVVDMPPEEATELKIELDKLNIDLIFLVAPTTTDQRLEHISKIASGYIYYVSLKGVTGAGNLDVDSVNHHLERMRNYIQLPVGVGFGIKDAQTAQQVGENADAVIVGSALVSIVEDLSSDRDKMVTKIGNLANEISGAIT
jgi:tryptophan synthase alpha chain